MPRPRVHDPDAILRAAEGVLVERGRAGLTVRALADRAGVSNGAIYHAFGSVDVVLARTWLRRAREFLDLQRRLVDDEFARAGAAGDVEVDRAGRAVCAAADAPAVFASADTAAATLLVQVRRADLLRSALPGPLSDDVRVLDRAVARLLRRLAVAVWDRGDAVAVDAIRSCVVRLPAALLFPGIRAGRVDGLARDQLAAAVLGVLSCALPDMTAEPTASTL